MLTAKDARNLNSESWCFELDLKIRQAIKRDESELVLGHMVGDTSELEHKIAILKDLGFKIDIGRWSTVFVKGVKPEKSSTVYLRW